MAGNETPSTARLALRERDRGQCILCGSGGLHYHHRRSRRVRDTHTHCLCNAVLLCQADHARVHANPTWSMTRGLIVSQHVTEPASVAVETFYGQVVLTCDGFITTPQEVQP